MKYQAVLFDLDGTLLNTIDDLSDSMNAVLEQRGFPLHTTEEYKLFIGNGIRNLVLRSLPEDKREDALIDSCTAAMKEEYNRRWDKKTHPYEKIPELLDGLREKGLKLAVLSNKADHFTKLIIEKFLSRWPFEAVFGERASVPKKPDPAAALEIAGLLNVSPSAFLYLGDSGTDMETAKAAGMYAVGALWGFRKADELLEHGAQTLIGSPLEMLNLL